MCKVDKQNEAEEEEEDGSNQGDVVTPGDEEAVGNQEADHDEGNPSDQLRTPETVLDWTAAITRGSNTQEEDCEDEVECTEREVHSVDGNKAIAIMSGDASYGHVVQS